MPNLPPLNEEDRANLVAYLDGELDEGAARALEAKLSLDPEGRAEAEALRQAWELLDYLPRAGPSPAFTERTLDRVSALRPSAASVGRRTRWRRRARLLGWAAAVLLAAVVGYAGTGLVAQRHWDRADQAAATEQLVRDLGVIEHLRPYEQVDDISFLRELDHPDLFGDESTGH